MFGFSVVLSASIFFLLIIFYQSAADELVASWHNNEAVNLQQGNILSSITKLQRAIEKSRIIKGATAIDETGRILVSVGEFQLSNVDVDFIPQKVISERKSGLFETTYCIAYSNVRVLIKTNAYILNYVLIFLLIYFFSVLVVFGRGFRNILLAQEKYKTELAVKDIKQRLAISEAVSELAKQVAHDIRAPMTVLNMVLHGIEIPEDRRSLFTSANSRIQNIANDLLKKSRVIVSGVEKNSDYERVGRVASSFQLLEAVSEIVDEKNVSLRRYKILFSKSLFKSLDVTVRGDKSDFQRVLSNLLQNSIESLKEVHDEILNASPVCVKLAQNKSNVVIEVADKGAGIPKEAMARIGEQGFSVGKKDGNGLGVYFAKKKVEEWGGIFRLVSSSSQGTVFQIELLMT
jgi:signal transduction histidine kinase